MTKEEFIIACEKRGYCSRDMARSYAKQYEKDSYDETDLEAAYRYQERTESYTNGLRSKHSKRKE